MTLRKFFFDQRGDPYQENLPTFFFFKYGQITYQSIDLPNLTFLILNELYSPLFTVDPSLIGIVFVSSVELKLEFLNERVVESIFWIGKIIN